LAPWLSDGLTTAGLPMICIDALPRFRTLQLRLAAPGHLHRERDVAGVDPAGLHRMALTAGLPGM
jgi:hypothetical protein